VQKVLEYISINSDKLYRLLQELTFCHLPCCLPVLHNLNFNSAAMYHPWTFVDVEVLLVLHNNTAISPWLSGHASFEA